MLRQFCVECLLSANQRSRGPGSYMVEGEEKTTSKEWDCAQYLADEILYWRFSGRCLLVVGDYQIRKWSLD